MRKENTPVVLCVDNFLNSLKHFTHNGDQDHFKETKTALANFVSWLKTRDVNHVGQITRFIISEFDLHLQELLARGEITDRSYAMIEDRISDFLEYCRKSNYLNDEEF